MARGWGKSEEDLGAEKEQSREDRQARGKTSHREDPQRVAKRRSLELSLARIEDLLAKTTQADRRKALEMAKKEILERLEDFDRR